MTPYDGEAAMMFDHRLAQATGVTRRDLLQRMGTGLLPLTVSTVWGDLSPAQAKTQGVPLQTLSPAEGRTLEALGEVLLPGAAAAGVAHFVDDQLRRDQPLLLITCLDYPGSYVRLYRRLRPADLSQNLHLSGDPLAAVCPQSGRRAGF